MRNKIIILGALAISGLAFSQVGVNTVTPKATFDIQGRKDSGGIALATDTAGLLAPRLNRTELNAKAEALYGSDQTGAIIYITSIAGAAVPGTQRANVTSIGYYYFDGSAWQRITTNTNTVGLDNTNDAFVNDTTNTMVKLGTNSDGTTTRVAGTEFVVKDNGRVGVGLASPSRMLDVNGSAFFKDVVTIKRNIEGGEIDLEGQNSTDLNWTIDQISNASTPRFRIFGGNSESNGIQILENGNVGVGTSTPTTKLHINSTTGTGLRISDGSEANNRILTSDASGNATWKDNISLKNSVFGVFNASASDIAMIPAGDKYVNTGAYIDIPPGKYSVSGTILLSIPVMKDLEKRAAWIRLTLNRSSAASASALGKDALIFSSNDLMSGSTYYPMEWGLANGIILINNTTGVNQKFFLWKTLCEAYNTAGSDPIIKLGGTVWGENQLVATPMN